MKKIVGILAVAAVATSLFAADVSAAVRIKGDLFNFDGSKESFSAMKVEAFSETYGAPAIATSFGDDKAGAQIKIVKVGAAQTADHLIWFKPFDALKVSMGTIPGMDLNTETIDWSQAIRTDSWGWAAEYNNEGIYVGVGIPSEFLTGAKSNVSIKDVYGKVGYTADFGTVAAVIKFAGEKKTAATADKYELDTEKGEFKKVPGTAASTTEAGIFAGAGYKGNINGITLFADVYYCSTSTNTFRNSWETFYGLNKPVIVDAFVAGNADALAYKAYAGFAFQTADGIADDAKMSLIVKALAEYKLDTVTAYLKVVDNNIMAKTFVMDIQPGVKGNVGCMSWDVSCKVTAQEKINISVPVEFNVGW